MAKSKYYKPKAGEAFLVPEDGKHEMACCDCGLVHNFKFDILVQGKRFHALPKRKFLALMKGLNMVVQITAARNNRATANRRRSKAVKKEIRRTYDEQR